jgi:hypothetical protein
MNYKSGQYVPFSDLVGTVITDLSGAEIGSGFIRITANNNVFKMYHEQDCCESVELNEIIGDLDDILNSPILLAEEVTETGGSRDECERWTWTFYKLSTIKGNVTLRWYGTSNGYYSEAVHFEFLNRIPSPLEKALK